MSHHFSAIESGQMLKLAAWYAAANCKKISPNLQQVITANNGQNVSQQKYRHRIRDISLMS